MIDTEPPRVPSEERRRIGLRAAIQRWERFWFEDVPSDGFAITRIAVGTAGLLSLIGFTPVDMFWSPDGIAPIPGDAGFRAYLLDSGLGLAAGWAIFLALFTAFACMIIGLFTGPAIIISYVGTVLQLQWNSLPLSSAHGLLIAVLFCLVWADCGARLSIDERRRRRGTAEAERAPERPLQSIWPLRLIRIQVAILYATSGLFKLLGPTWRDGSAVYHATHQNVYGRIFQAFPPAPELEWTFTLLTYMTILWELSFPLMLLNRTTRLVALASGVAMHLGILATMEVGPFTIMILATYVAFLDPHAVARSLTSVRSKMPGSRTGARVAMTPTASGPTPAA